MDIRDPGGWGGMHTEGVMLAGLPGHSTAKDQPAARAENMISSWLRTRSQFWHLVRQRSVIH